MEKFWFLYYLYLWSSFWQSSKIAFWRKLQINFYRLIILSQISLINSRILSMYRKWLASWSVSYHLWNKSAIIRRCVIWWQNSLIYDQKWIRKKSLKQNFIKNDSKMTCDSKRQSNKMLVFDSIEKHQPFWLCHWISIKYMNVNKWNLFDYYRWYLEMIYMIRCCHNFHSWLNEVRRNGN